jgi:hypothetical protein
VEICDAASPDEGVRGSMFFWVYVGPSSADGP